MATCKEPGACRLAGVQGKIAWLVWVLLLSMSPSTGLSQQASEEFPPIRPLRTGGLKAEVAALIMSGQEGGAIPLEVLVLPMPGGTDLVRVPLVVEIAGDALVGDHDGGPFRFEIYAYALSARGGLQGSLLQTFEIDLERLDPRPETSGVRFFGEMDLPQGEYSLRVLVRRSNTEHVGLRVIPLKIPKKEIEGSVLLAPLILDDHSKWLELSEVRGRNAPQRENLSFLSPAPAAKAVISPHQDISFRLLALHPESVNAVLTVELADPGGRRVAEIEARVSSFSPSSAQRGYRILEGKFRATGLVHGEYQLKVVLHEGEEQIESPSVPVVVFEQSAEQSVAANDAVVVSWAWPQITSEMLLSSQATGLTGPPPAEGAPGRKTKKRKIDPRPLAVAYNKVLGLLAEGQEAKAQTELFRQSLELLKKEGSEGLQVLAEVEMLNANRLAEVRPEALFPVALLHHELYQDARHHKVALIATHARTTTLRLAELYAERSPSAAARSHVADIFASIGGALLEAELYRFSERLFRRALEFQEFHSMSLLSLGMSYEKIGEYEGSVGFLNQLVEAHPDAWQGHLRLAINLIRLRREKAAVRHLRQALKSPESWVKCLAYQELARLHLQANEMGEAEEVLRQGIETLPDEGRLYVLLAFALDAQQQPEKAGEVLEKMVLQANKNQASPRRRYSQGSEETLAGLRRELKRQGEIRRGALEEALAKFEEGL